MTRSEVEQIVREYLPAATREDIDDVVLMSRDSAYRYSDGRTSWPDEAIVRDEARRLRDRLNHLSGAA